MATLALDGPGANGPIACLSPRIVCRDFGIVLAIWSNIRSDEIASAIY